MKRLPFAFPLLVALALLPALAGAALAQQRVPGTRTTVPSPLALGMGGAATAYPTARTALFYNPAHLTDLRTTRAPVTMFGLGGSISSNVGRQIDFYNDRLEPAFVDGIENLSDEDKQALYDEAFDLGKTPTVISGNILFPSFVMNRGAYGFGGGVFAHSEAAYSVEDAGAGVPGMDFTALMDFIAVAAGAIDFTPLGLKGFSAGATTKLTQRYLSLKLKPIDALDTDESLYMLGANAVSVDLGLLYRAGLGRVPGALYLGASWSDLSIKEFNYKFAAYYVRKETVRDDEAIASEVALAQRRYQLASTFRAGAAYVFPVLAGPFKETVLAVDYVRVPYALDDRPTLANLSFGFQTSLGDVLHLRTGLNQGYTTVGAGLQLSLIRIDYAYFGSEQGRLPGQSPSWHHLLQISLGSF